MKNLLGILAVLGMLLVTSCSQSDLVTESLTSDFINATFTLGTDDGIDSRTEANAPVIGDGTKVDKVACAVYNADGMELKELYDVVDVADKTATYNVRLAKGQVYRVAFFAYNEAAEAYDVRDLKNVVVVDDQLSNVEGRDAFTATIPVKAGLTAINQDVILKRPFAQLNLGIDEAEYQAALKAGIEVAKTKIVVSNVHSAFNAYEDEIVGSNEDGEIMVFELNNIPTETLKADIDGDGTNEEYKYLALNYLLVGDKSLTDIKFMWEGTNGETNADAITEFNNIPVQRNYRTNIIGKLLTSPATFNISIDASFTGDNNEPHPDYNIYKVFSAQDLQAALDAAPEGYTTTIYLGADIVGDVTDVQKPGRKVVIDGCKYKYNGSIKVHSNSNYYADAALTIKNVKFETSTASVNIIEALENGSERYSNNITVEDCTFTATGEAINTSVAVQVKATRNVTVTGCTATNMHSLIQAQSCDTGDVKVVNCTVNGKNGVAFKQVKSATVEGSTINAIAYGIRFDGNTDNYGITVKGNKVTASQPFIVRRMTGANNTIALESENTLTVSAASASTDAPAYQIIITNGEDDAEYVKPTGTYTLTGADKYLVYPRDYYFPVATWDEFTAALAANEPKIKLTDNIEYSGNYSLKKNVVIDLNGKSITMPMFYVFSTATIMNGTINGKMYARTGCKATLEGLTFSGTISDDLSTEGHLQVQGSCDVYAKNCTFAATTVNGSQTRSLSIEGSSSGIRKFEGCDFKFVSWGTGAGKYKKNVYINTMNGTTTVDFTDCKLNGKAPNIIFAAAYPLTNLTMSGCDNTAPTLEINRAKDTVTEADWAHISSLIANNKFTQVRVFYNSTTSEYIKK